MLEVYEEEVLKAMYDKSYIGTNYKAIEIISSGINWSSIQRKFNVRSSFKKVIRGLMTKGYVTDHGKSARVASLTRLGVSYVRGLELLSKSEKPKESLF